MEPEDVWWGCVCMHVCVCTHMCTCCVCVVVVVVLKGKA